MEGKKEIRKDTASASCCHQHSFLIPLLGLERYRDLYRHCFESSLDRLIMKRALGHSFFLAAVMLYTNKVAEISLFVSISFFHTFTPAYTHFSLFSPSSLILYTLSPFISLSLTLILSPLPLSISLCPFSLTLIHIPSHEAYFHMRPLYPLLPQPLLLQTSSRLPLCSGTASRKALLYLFNSFQGCKA